MTTIGASVGQGGVNQDADVRIVQELLNNFVTRLGLKQIGIDGDCGKNTKTAIRAFQKQIVGIANPDGRIDPGGRTFQRLSLSQAVLAAQPEPDPGELSGATWWQAHQGNYANSHSLLDLASPFRENVTAFIQAMRDAGATVGISATRRNRIRAYLMHYSFRLGRGELKAKDVPAQPGCPIRWDHGDEAKSCAAAKAMSDLFAIAFKPSLTSLHIEGRAIDMTIGWSGTLAIKDKQGHVKQVGAPRDGGNAALQAVGASYGVIKLASDPPHWSDNGH
ncbi:MAG: peptidoglycan-binding protein [Sphingomonadales bacterium]|nr:peptidoglycan-binding protein [Sphingomonadales bacterium]